MEEITTNVENAISQNLGAKPIEIRRFENKITVIGSLVYFLGFILTLVIFFLVINNFKDDYILSIWLPVGIVLFSSTIILINHLVRIQPIDLSSWLEKDRSNNPHASMLYRESQKVREFISSRSSSHEGIIAKGQKRSNFPFIFLVAILTVILFDFLYFVPYLIQNIINDMGIDAISQYRLILELIILILVVIKLSSYFNVGHINPKGGKLISLISEYRKFLKSIVYRVRNGALGQVQKKKF